MKSSKKLMIGILILVIIIISLLIVISVIKGKKEYKEEAEGVLIKNDIQPVTSQTMFYTVQNAIQKYLSYTHLNINEDLEIEITQNQTLAEIYKISTEDEKRQAIMDFLDTSFIEKNNINLNNIHNFINISTNKIDKCLIKQIYTLENLQIQPYVASVELQLEDENGQKIKEECKYIITLDTYNATFMVEPIKQEINIEEVQLNKEIKSIGVNNRNTYVYIRFNDGEISEKYFSEFKEIILNNQEEAYNLLNEEYRNIRFRSLEDFKNYVEKNREEISKNNISKYLVNKYEDYTEYNCMDRYQNVYAFRVYAVKNYDVKLDTYTIPTKKFKDEYNSSNDQNKIMLNVDKWIQMLNNRDYSAAYKVLDETFRNNNFGSEEKFEQYMREKFPLHYKLEFGEYSNEADIGMQKIILRDITGEDLEIIENTIIMQLKDDYDFVMSFEIK